MTALRHLALGFFLLVVAALTAAAAEPTKKPATENVVLLMADGLRWQEVFSGAEEILMTKENGGVADVDSLKKTFWRDTPEARREALMPFLWSVIAKQGQIFGNKAKGSEARVTNEMHFSYPGYNEVLTGFYDPRIDSNDKKLNPNITVFEWLHRKPGFGGKVAAITCWDVFPFIFNYERCGFPVNAANEPLVVSPSNPKIELINRLKTQTTHYFPSETWDSFVQASAVEYVKQERPRLLFVSLGETDSWCHAGRYDLYLHAVREADGCLKELWETMQAMPEYRGKTSFVITVDHGRGNAPVAWKSHGRDIEEDHFIWVACLGPDTPALGMRENVPPVTQSQVAATVAALVGEDYCAAVPQAGKPIADVLRPAR